MQRSECVKFDEFLRSQCSLHDTSDNHDDNNHDYDETVGDHFLVPKVLKGVVFTSHAK